MVKFLLQRSKIVEPDMTNIPSGLKEASRVELLEIGLTLWVDN